MANFPGPLPSWWEWRPRPGHSSPQDSHPSLAPQSWPFHAPRARHARKVLLNEQGQCPQAGCSRMVYPSCTRAKAHPCGSLEVSQIITNPTLRGTQNTEVRKLYLKHRQNFRIFRCVHWPVSSILLSRRVMYITVPWTSKTTVERDSASSSTSMLVMSSATATP